MRKSEHFFKSLISAVGVFIYISAVSWTMFNGQEIFGEVSNFLMPLFLLILFVISAAITGLLVLGKPVHLYLSGLKKEAFILLFATLAWLVISLAIVAVVLVLQ